MNRTFLSRAGRVAGGVVAAWALWACATANSPAVLTALQDFGAAPLVLIGEQHDADAHQQVQAQAVARLVAHGQLGALALEMAQAPHHTVGLPSDASPAQVRATLQWDDAGWPWERYSAAVMHAVRAGVPVHGVNLAREQLRAAMADAALDRRLDAQALATQQQAVRAGHCGLLPESQIAPITRVQIARDAQMAQSLAQLSSNTPDKTVLLLAGTGHVRRDVGITALMRRSGDAAQARLADSARVLWLVAGDGTPPEAALGGTDRVLQTPAPPPADYCAGLRERFRPREQTP